MTRTKSIIELYDLTVLFGLFLETSKHQNLMRVRLPINDKLVVTQLNRLECTCHDEILVLVFCINIIMSLLLKGSTLKTEM